MSCIFLLEDTSWYTNTNTHTHAHTDRARASSPNRLGLARAITSPFFSPNIFCCAVIARRLINRLSVCLKIKITPYVQIGWEFPLSSHTRTSAIYSRGPAAHSLVRYFVGEKKVPIHFGAPSKLWSSRSESQLSRVLVTHWSCSWRHGIIGGWVGRGGDGGVITPWGCKIITELYRHGHKPASCLLLALHNQP